MAAFRELFPETLPGSLLDVGCGTGPWLRAAGDMGVDDIVGVDGVEIPAGQLLFPPERFLVRDFTQAWNLGRRFDAALCLEVGEHLDAKDAGTLLDALVKHADTVVFSAACPGQPGQHHVNCQWPEYWQGLFNERGYACADEVRWRIWEMKSIEPWYRQNIFLARRSPETAGQEPRIRAVLHPDILEYFIEDSIGLHAGHIAAGCLPLRWYLAAPWKVASGKARQWFSGGDSAPVRKGV